MCIFCSTIARKFERRKKKLDAEFETYSEGFAAKPREEKEEKRKPDWLENPNIAANRLSSPRVRREGASTTEDTGAGGVGAGNTRPLSSRADQSRTSAVPLFHQMATRSGGESKVDKDQSSSPTNKAPFIDIPITKVEPPSEKVNKTIAVDRKHSITQVPSPKSRSGTPRVAEKFAADREQKNREQRRLFTKSVVVDNRFINNLMNADKL